MALVTKKPGAKKSNNVIADATDRLLRATKDKMLRDSNGSIDYEKLKRQGFSAAMIARLKTI